MPEMERRSFLGLAIASLPLTLFTQSSQVEALASGALVPAGEDRFAKIRPIPTGSSTFKVSTQDSQGGLFVMEHSNQKKGGPPRHLHHNEDEWFYVIQVVSASTTDTFLPWRKSSLPWKHSLDIGLTETRPCVGYAQLLKTLRIAYAPAGKMEAFFAERDKHGGTAYSTDLALYMACDMELLGPPLPLD